MFATFRRLLVPMKAHTPPRCLAGCGALADQQERLTNGRVLCTSCGRDYAAWQDEASGDWHANPEPLRYKLRRKATAAEPSG